MPSGSSSDVTTASSAVCFAGRRAVERQLVDRKRPHDTVRHDEGERPDLAGVNVVEQPPEHLHVARAGERVGAGDGGDEPRSAGDDQRVVLRLAAVVEERL
jgi:hypothetical protein